MLFRTHQIFRLFCALLLCLLLGIGAQTASANEHDVQLSVELSSEMNQYGFTKSEQQAVQELITTMERSRLPSAPIAHKVREGIAKGYPESAIVKAASVVAKRLTDASSQAQQLAGQQDPEQAAELVETITEAYAAGLKVESCQTLVLKLRQLNQEMSGPDFQALAQETMLAARDLVRRQVKSQTATELVLELLNMERPGQEMVELRNQLRSNTQAGTAERTAQQMTLRLRSGQGADSGAGGSGSGNGGNSSGGQGQAGNGGGKGR